MVAIVVLTSLREFPVAALVNVAVAVLVLIWYFRRQPRLDYRARTFRWIAVFLGISLFVYANVSETLTRNSAAWTAAIGGLLALNFVFFPQLAAWIIRGLSRRP
jgi:hypothetical protein